MLNDGRVGRDDPRVAAGMIINRRVDMPYKPEGYTSAAPYLLCDGAQRVIDFVKEVFGAEELRRYEADDGSILHAEVRIDDTVVMLGDAGGEWRSFESYVHVYVREAETVYRRGLSAGGESVQEPTRREGDPDMRGGVKDPSGNTWWIATQVSD